MLAVACGTGHTLTQGMAEQLTDIPRTAPQPPAGTPVVVARWVRLVILPLAVLALYALAHAAGHVLLLFIVAAVIALILNPLVALAQRARVPRTRARGGGRRYSRRPRCRRCPPRACRRRPAPS